MAVNAIVVNVIYQAKPGMRERFVEEVTRHGILSETRAEAGCLRYEYFAALDDPDRLFLLEHWADQAAVERHRGTKHMAQLQELKRIYVAECVIQRFAPPAPVC